ncbi:hypothetical protein [Dyadobacter sp. 676]|uniref:YopX protein domain-containing protein n=1 Tax=Dyadobacter sp. 676 TaxID=3088362 RepID=A0AAU8FU96_9BACT
MPYEISFNRKPNFRVRYRLYSYEEGGRYRPAFQHYRCDFHYKNDGKFKHSLYMTWPEFEDENGNISDEAEYVPMSGTARIWIVSKKFIPYHKEYLKIGTMGYFHEGGKKVGECDVIEWIEL